MSSSIHTVDENHLFAARVAMPHTPFWGCGQLFR